MLNHEPLIKAWTDAAREQATTSALPWKDLIEKFHDKFKDVIVEGSEHHLEKPLADAVARCVYQLTGAGVQTLSKAIDQGLTAVGEKIPLGKSKWLMGVVGWVAHVGNPNLVVVDLRGQLSRKDAARMLAGMLAAMSGDDAQKFRSGARAALDKLADAEGTLHPYHGVMLVDQAKAKELAGLSGSARQTAMAGLLTPAQFDEIMETSAGKLANMDFKSGVAQLFFSSLTLRSAYQDMMKAAPADAMAKGINFAAGVVGLVGTMGQAAGALLSKAEWGAAKTARQFKFMAIELETRAGWFIGVGKLMGVLGGVVAGVLVIIDGWKMKGNHPVLGYLNITLGISSVIAACLMLFVGIAGIAFLVGLVIMALMTVIAWLTPNALQDWLAKSLYFGKGGDGPFDGPVAQTVELQALAKGS
ncbi:hypothetical protein [Paraburkholderia sp. WP4_3_2]|nr:hypothetical protein [Paraburkholderia sp. WP4_3_2]